MSGAVAIDARMLGASGIGTYLDALLTRIVPALAPRRVFLLGDLSALARREHTRAPNVTLIPCTAAIYGPWEQPALSMATPREVTTFWAPHVNAPVRFRGRLVVTVHDAYYLLPEARREVRLDKWLYLQAMYASVARRADAIACVSAFTAAELQARLGIEPERLQVVHNGLDPSWLEPQARARAHAAPYVLFVGNARPHKNLARLLAAFRRLEGAVPHDLVVVGRLYDPPAAGPRVHFAGSVELEVLRDLYAHASAFVMPSLYEGFGLPPLEAMASRVPVVAARAAALPEICGEAAHYCDPLDEADIARKLREVLENEALRRRLLAAGSRRVAEFSWDVTADAMLRLLSR